MTQYHYGTSRSSFPHRPRFPQSSTKISAYTHSRHYYRSSSSTPPPSSPQPPSEKEIDEGPPYCPAFTSPDIKDTNPSLPNEELSKCLQIRTHPNGGASVVHLDYSDFESCSDKGSLVERFFEEVFSEDSDGFAHHVMGIVHNGAKYLPELVCHFSQTHPDLRVKMGNIRNPEIETTTFAEFSSKVTSSYSNGTFRCGPLLQVTLVQQVSEESGKYFPEFLGERERVRREREREREREERERERRERGREERVSILN